MVGRGAVSFGDSDASGGGDVAIRFSKPFPLET